MEIINTYHAILRWSRCSHIVHKYWLNNSIKIAKRWSQIDSLHQSNASRLLKKTLDFNLKFKKSFLYLLARVGMSNNGWWTILKDRVWKVGAIIESVNDTNPITKFNPFDATDRIWLDAVMIQRCEIRVPCDTWRLRFETLRIETMKGTWRLTAFWPPAIRELWSLPCTLREPGCHLHFNIISLSKYYIPIILYLPLIKKPEPRIIQSDTFLSFYKKQTEKVCKNYAYLYNCLIALYP
jgi:hypothetical protein